MFSEIDLRLSAVKRWVIVPTIREQSVAEHQYNVAIIAGRLAREFFEIDDSVTLLNIYEWALTHDRPEALSGDIPAIVKDLYDEKEHERRYIDLLDTHNIPRHVRLIVKLADRIDALIFLRMEMSMGNNSVIAVYDEVYDKMVEIIREIDQDELEYYIIKNLEVLFPHDGLFVSNTYNRRNK